MSAARYLYFSLQGRSALVPWIWSARALNVAGAVVLLTPALRRRRESSMRRSSCSAPRSG